MFRDLLFWRGIEISEAGIRMEEVQADPARLSRSLSLKAFQDLRSFLLDSSSRMMSRRVRRVVRLLDTAALLANTSSRVNPASESRWLSVAAGI